MLLIVPHYASNILYAFHPLLCRHNRRKPTSGPQPVQVQVLLVKVDRSDVI